MFLMSDVYDELLDAAIQQLQDLKTQGVRFIPVSPEGLAGLNQAPRARPISESRREIIGQASPAKAGSPSSAPPIAPKPVVPTPAPSVLPPPAPVAAEV